MVKILDQEIFLSFYGDDFTGSTDVMESLTMSGIPTALFLAPPSLEEIQAFRLKNPLSNIQGKGIQAYGVAGVSRIMNPTQMDQDLPGVFKAIQKIPTNFFHYKTCSTFDSSSTVGSIGQATELAFEWWPSAWIPLIVGLPFLNRFCIFGNLFARIDGTTFRLDRHPTMSKHPTTPMNESDLRKHLAKQTQRSVQLMDVLTLNEDFGHQVNHFNTINHQTGDYVLFDTLTDAHLRDAGKLICQQQNGKTQLVVGSSGVEYALCFHLEKEGMIQNMKLSQAPGKAQQLIVMAGSCSPTTHQQILWAIDDGFEDIRIESTALIDPDRQEQETQRLFSQAFAGLQEGKNVMLFSAMGPDDPAIEKTNQKIKELQLGEQQAGEVLGQRQGMILKQLLLENKNTRVVVAGGDTSGQVARELGIYALEVLIPVAPGAPLCIAHSKDPQFDGLEISLKGGQCGSPNYFEEILLGEI